MLLQPKRAGKPLALLSRRRGHHLGVTRFSFPLEVRNKVAFKCNPLPEEYFFIFCFCAYHLFRTRPSSFLSFFFCRRPLFEALRRSSRLCRKEAGVCGVPPRTSWQFYFGSEARSVWLSLLDHLHIHSPLVFSSDDGF